MQKQISLCSLFQSDNMSVSCIHPVSTAPKWPRSDASDVVVSYFMRECSCTSDPHGLLEDFMDSNRSAQATSVPQKSGRDTLSCIRQNFVPQQQNLIYLKCEYWPKMSAATPFYHLFLESISIDPSWWWQWFQYWQPPSLRQPSSFSLCVTHTHTHTVCLANHADEFGCGCLASWGSFSVCFSTCACACVCLLFCGCVEASVL